MIVNIRKDASRDTDHELPKVVPDHFVFPQVTAFLYGE